jgi:S-adenosylmethionine:tRNA ribosyltransferase-isomerase
MKTKDFEYNLPKERIAQQPIEPRDASRLLILNRSDGSREHAHFRDLKRFLRDGDLLVCNESRVIPARLCGYKSETGGQVEVLLLRQLEACRWEGLTRGRRIRPGLKLDFEVPGEPKLQATVEDIVEGGKRVLCFSRPIGVLLEKLGVVPLPPYIHETLADPERYQTIYARVTGSVAAPTAGLHFTPSLIEQLGKKGVRFAFVVLHIGLDTFRPVDVEELEDHPMHAEWCRLPPQVVEAVLATRQAGRRVVAVGTTAVRVLEAGAQIGESQGKVLAPFEGWTRLFIYPGYQFRVVDALVTNFHLPRSTLLMLVSAFAGHEMILQSYEEAVFKGYRFYSFGDAMFIL